MATSPSRFSDEERVFHTTAATADFLNASRTEDGRRRASAAGCST